MLHLTKKGVRRRFVFVVLVALADRGSADTVRIDVTDEQGKPLPCRIHLKDPAGDAVRVEGLPFWDDHFVCPGTVASHLSPGEYPYEIERGPEYARKSGRFTVQPNQPTSVSIQLERIADLASQGWWSGELHVHRKPEEMELLMRAEDLHVAPVITWWNHDNPWAEPAIPQDVLRQFDVNRFYHLMAGEDEREGGALMFFNLSRPLDITAANREYPSPVKFIHDAQAHPAAWVDIEKPFWWDVPAWLATGAIDSIGLANNHMCRSKMYETEAWGRPRNAQRLPPPRGNGFWTQELYYHVLNTGLRIPPSAGSASGVLPNPVGYNRVYVHAGKGLTYDGWWRALRAGRSFVTNGPLLLCRANGMLPGSIFSAGDSFLLDIEIELISADRVPLIELIQNGEVIKTIPCDPTAVTQRHTTQLNFHDSGWFLARAIADKPETFRFASTAPFYVEVGQTKRRVSHRSATFFRDWAIERMQRIGLDDPSQRREVLKYHQQALDFWEKRIEMANAE